MMSRDYEVQLPVFEGPLDLLLHIIEREELDITTIALAQVTDQYMTYLAELEQRDVRDLTHFLVVAAKLLLIKSQALLPRPPVTTSEVEDVGDELVRQLQAYKRFKEIAALLQGRETEGLRGYVRIAPPPRLNPQPDLGGATLDNLLAVVREVLDAIPAPSADEVVAPITLTIADQIAHIENQLARRPQIRFRDILSRAVTRVEVIVTLWAVLELIKQDRVQVQQERLFGEIIIVRAEAVEAIAADDPLLPPDAASTAIPAA
jgi:segregation and condensation protein A